MIAFVYRSDRKQGAYVYLREKDALSLVPADLQKALQPLVFTLQFELTRERRLAQADAAAVHANLQTIGYHVQFPPNETIARDLSLDD